MILVKEQQQVWLTFTRSTLLKNSYKKTTRVTEYTGVEVFSGDEKLRRSRASHRE